MISIAAPVHQCKVDIGPHFLIPKLELLEVWPDRLIFQRATPLHIMFSAIEKIELKYWWGNWTILLHYKDFTGIIQKLRFVDSNRLTPNNANTRVLYDILQKLQAADQTRRAGGDIFVAPQADTAPMTAVVQDSYEAQAQREVSGWGAALMLGGILSLFGSALIGLAPLWGLFILLVGVVAWRTKETPWLIVIAMCMWWAAIKNLNASNARFISSALWELLLGGVLLYRYVATRRKLKRPLAELSPTALRWMALLAPLASVLSVIAFASDLVSYIMLRNSTLDVILTALTSALAVLGFSCGLASLLSFPRRRALAITGLLVGLLTLVILLLLAFA